MKVCFYSGERNKIKSYFFMPSKRDLYEGSFQYKVGDDMYLYIRTDNEICFECNHLWITESSMVERYIPQNLPYEVLGVEDEKYEVKEFIHWGS